jgi:hypothetical protein
MNTAFVASAHTEYWLSIVPDLATLPQWAWVEGTGGEGTAYSCAASTCGLFPNDLAFTLYTSSPVSTPEPAGVSLLVTALAALGAKLYKKLA